MKSLYKLRGVLGRVAAGLAGAGLIAVLGCGSSGGGSGSTGGGGGGTTPTQATLAAGGATSIYVIQGAPAPTGYTILGFAADASGAVQPTGSLVPSADMVVHAVATDTAGRVYIAGELTGNEVILGYSAGATGSAIPFRTLVLDPTSTEGMQVSSMAIDSNETIYATGLNTSGVTGNVAVFPAADNGTVAPSRFLSSTQMTQPIGIAVDAAGEIFVSNVPPPETLLQGSILVFPAGANGPTTPSRVITAPTATATVQNEYYGIAVDAGGDIFTVYNTDTFNSSGILSATTAEIEEFAAGSNGAASPTKTVSGVDTALTLGGGLRLDSVGNLYLVNFSGTVSQPTPSILGFGPQATGDMSPGLQVTAGAWSLGGSELAVF